MAHTLWVRVEAVARRIQVLEAAVLRRQMAAVEVQHKLTEEEEELSRTLVEGEGEEVLMFPQFSLHKHMLFSLLHRLVNSCNVERLALPSL